MEPTPRSLFDAIGSFSHNIGIYLTYTLDNRVIDKLTEYADGTLTILHDYRLGVSLENNVNSSILTIPVKSPSNSGRNCFHPKLILLKNSESARIIIGSANLTRESFIAAEKEIVIQIDVHFEDAPTLIPFYHSIVNFLDTVQADFVVPNACFQFLLQQLRLVIETTPDTERIRFLYSREDRSMLSEIMNFLSDHAFVEKAQELIVATPFISSRYSAHSFEKLAHNITFFLRNGTAIPDAFQSHAIFQPGSRSRRTNFHAKILLLKFKKQVVAWIGSANFSEQGFFRDIKRGGNQEIGVIFITTGDELNHWFNEKHWKRISLEDYQSTKTGNIETIASPHVYAWAEVSGTQVFVYIFNPYHEAVKQHNRKITCKLLSDAIYRTSALKKTKQGDKEIIRFNVGKNEIIVDIFLAHDFFTAAGRKESLFSQFVNIYSIVPSEVDKEIDSNKINVPGMPNIRISEPPKLEQHFHNVRRHVQIIQRRAIFSEMNMEEFKDKLTEVKDIRTFYSALKFYQVLQLKPGASAIAAIVRDKIMEMVSLHHVSHSTFKKFFQTWLHSKH